MFLFSEQTPEALGEPTSFRMAILGATGVGKTALIHQFRTSECINAYDCNASKLIIAVFGGSVVSNKVILGNAKDLGDIELLHVNLAIGTA